MSSTMLAPNKFYNMKYLSELDEGQWENHEHYKHTIKRPMAIHLDTHVLSQFRTHTHRRTGETLMIEKESGRESYCMVGFMKNDSFKLKMSNWNGEKLRIIMTTTHDVYYE